MLPTSSINAPWLPTMSQQWCHLKQSARRDWLTVECSSTNRPRMTTNYKHQSGWMLPEAEHENVNVKSPYFEERVQLLHKIIRLPEVSISVKSSFLALPATRWTIRGSAIRSDETWALSGRCPCHNWKHSMRCFRGTVATKTWWFLKTANIQHQKID